jgi:preprotein translocase subunit SecF
LIAGILSGTYSSIFIASPIWYNLNMIVHKPKYIGK